MTHILFIKMMYSCCIHVKIVQIVLKSHGFSSSLQTYEWLGQPHRFFKNSVLPIYFTSHSLKDVKNPINKIKYPSPNCSASSPLPAPLVMMQVKTCMLNRKSSAELQSFSFRRTKTTDSIELLFIKLRKHVQPDPDPSELQQSFICCFSLVQFRLLQRSPVERQRNVGESGWFYRSRSDAEFRIGAAVVDSEKQSIFSSVLSQVSVCVTLL